MSHERIDHPYRREFVEIRIPCVYPFDTVFLHENCDACIEYKVTGDIGMLLKKLFRRTGMHVGFRQDRESGRGTDRVHETPRIAYGPWPLEHPRMCNDAHKFIQDSPSDVPDARLSAPPLEEISTYAVLQGIFVRPIDEDICIHNEH